MNDYYQEISATASSRVEGKFVGWVEVSKKRTEYSTGSGTSTREKSALLTEALDKLRGKNGKDALKDYDGIFFLYAGGRVQTTRGGLYWPHRANVTPRRQAWPYFIVQEGGERMNDISVFCHEFGHMLGLPDLYARPEVPGMEGVGVWCAMSQPERRRPAAALLGVEQGAARLAQADRHRPAGEAEARPRRRSRTTRRSASRSWSGPTAASTSCWRTARKKGFDAALPAEGLLIWRVVPGNRASRCSWRSRTGWKGRPARGSTPGSVPFPSPANDCVHPVHDAVEQEPARRRAGGVHHQHPPLPDGRVTFHIGYEYQ